MDARIIMTMAIQMDTRMIASAERQNETDNTMIAFAEWQMKRKQERSFMGQQKVWCQSVAEIFA